MRIIPAPKKTPGGVRREIVPVPDGLRAKALAFDAETSEAIDAAVARALAAQEKVLTAHADHLSTETGRLAALVEAMAKVPGDGALAGRVFRAAHRLRDAALALDAPLVARLAGSLARLLEREAPSRKAIALARAHVDALVAAERDGTPGDDPVALALARELEGAVARERRPPVR